MRTLLLLFGLGASILTSSATPFHFVAHGDTGYTKLEKIVYQQLILEINRTKPAFTIHVGDIWGNEKATDAAYRGMLEKFSRFDHPLIYTPGDNEWADTWQKGRGPYDTLERLSSLRKIYFPDNQSLGKRKITLSRQNNFPENAMWSHQNVHFCTVHTVPPSETRPAQKKRTSEEYQKRTKANIKWMQQAFKKAKQNQAPALIFAWHPWMFNKDGSTSKRYQSFLTTFLKEAQSFPGKILIIHGDAHTYIVDQPFSKAKNITRLEVYGSPITSAVTVGVDTSQPDIFTFTQVKPQKKP